MDLLTILEQLINEERISHEVQRMVERAKIPTHIAQNLVIQIDIKLQELNRQLGPLYQKRDRYGRPLIDTLPTTAWFQFNLKQPVKSEAGHLITGGLFIIGRSGRGFHINTVFTNVEPTTGQPMISPQGIPLKKSGQPVDGLPMTQMIKRIQQLLQN